METGVQTVKFQKRQSPTVVFAVCTIAVIGLIIYFSFLAIRQRTEQQVLQLSQNKQQLQDQKNEIVALPAKTFSFAGPAWIVVFRDGANSIEWSPPPDATVVTQAEGNTATYTWKELQTQAGPLTVELTKTKESEKKLRFQLSARLEQPGTVSLEQLSLSTTVAPRTPALPGAQALMIPLFTGGKTLYNPYSKPYEKTTAYYGIWQLPFVLLYDEQNKEGVSWRIEDQGSQMLALTTEIGNGKVRISPGSKVSFAATSMKTPQIVLEVYEGTAFEGMTLYREWALNQSWARVPKVEHNKMIPSALKNSPFMVAVGTVDGSYDRKYFEKMVEYYQSLAGTKSLVFIFLGYWDNKTAFPEAYSTRLPGLSEVLQLANVADVLTIAHQSLNAQLTSRSGIKQSDIAADCLGNLRALESLQPTAYSFKPNTDSMQIIEQNLLSQVRLIWDSHAEFHMNFLDHFDPEKHDACSDGPEIMTSMRELLKHMTNNQPKHYGVATEALFDRYLKFAPMSNALDGDVCKGVGDTNIPFMSYIYNDMSARTGNIMVETALDLNRAYTEQLFSTIVQGKIPFFMDIQDLPEKQFYSVQILPSLEKAIKEISRMFQLWRRFIRFGQKLPDLSNVEVAKVPREALGYTAATCITAEHPLVVHGVFKYEMTDRSEWGIVLLNWNDPKVKIPTDAPQALKETLAQQRTSFRGVFDPVRYGVPIDGTYWLLHYSKATGKLEEIAPVIGPMPIIADLEPLSSGLFVVKRR